MTGCGTYSPSNGSQVARTAGVIDGLHHDGTGADPARAGRFYDAVVALPDNRYVAGTDGPGGAAWVQRYRAAGATTTFGGGASVLAASALHALALLGDGTVLAAGETVDAAVAANRQMTLVRIRDGPMAASCPARALARCRRQQHRPGAGRATRRQGDRRRLRQPRRQDRVRAHALQRDGRARRLFGNNGEIDHAVRHSRGQRLHHRHGAREAASWASRDG